MQGRYRQLLRQVEDTFTALPDKPEDTPCAVLNALWLCAQDKLVSTSLAASEKLTPLTCEQAERLNSYLAQLAQGVPVAHMVKRQNFCGIELIASEDALIPRLETELLVEAALDISDGLARPPGTVVDLCCGSGNIALALASKLPQTKVFGSDMSSEAIDLAERNACFTGLQERVEFFIGDMLEPFRTPKFESQVDLITCNPPYISSAKVEQMPQEIAEYEPKMAFDGGPFGFSIIQKLISNAPDMLKADGWLVFEVGLGQAAPLLKRHSNNKKYQQALGYSDTNRNTRVIAMQVGS